MKRLSWLLASLLLWGCGTVLGVKQIPEIVVGEAKFFRTIEAHTDAPVTSGNRIDVLLNGDESFPVMLDEIRKAKSSITFAQYLYEDGAIRIASSRLAGWQYRKPKPGRNHSSDE
jgi:phosphatidylserine/phosphatidylglycerophosphate/cardiolipin synthase-like enzyme